MSNEATEIPKYPTPDEVIEAQRATIKNLQAKNRALRGANTKLKKNRQNVKDSERAAWRAANRYDDEAHAIKKELLAIDQRHETEIRLKGKETEWAGAVTHGRELTIKGVYGTANETKQLVRELIDMLEGTETS